MADTPLTGTENIGKTIKTTAVAAQTFIITKPDANTETYTP